MRFIFIAISFILLTNIGWSIENRKIIVVLDTGYSNTEKPDIICDIPLQDFSPTHDIKDYAGHASNVIAIIAKHIDSHKYCILPVKWYPVGYINALKYVVTLHPYMVNFSGGGTDPSASEYVLYSRLVGEGTIVNVAAGNNGIELSKDKCHYYPACYRLDLKSKNFNVVGASDLPDSSNYGMMVNRWEKGKDVNAGGYKMSGTSQACAAYTAKLVTK